jgi:predicted CXXCH cytochrome family protein
LIYIIYRNNIYRDNTLLFVYNKAKILKGGGNMFSVRLLCILLILLILPAFAFAAGKHEGLNCVGCHGIHNAKTGEDIFGVDPNTKAISPWTKKPFEGTTALCLGCHETTDRGGLGILAVSASHSHPYGIVPNPKVATVPDVFLRNGKLECVGCHDPHPSCLNYKYLRVDTAKGAKMGNFCAMCHPSKADPSVLKDLRIFNSMDEKKFAPPAPSMKK